MGNTEIKSIEVLKIDELTPVQYRPKLTTPKDLERFIKKTVSMVRASNEYREYIAYLKREVDMTRCAFFPNMGAGGSDGQRKKKVKLEIHHEPFTLFDIVEIVTSKWINTGRDVNHLEIAEEVMGLHFQGRVGLIPLVVTVHQLVHRGDVIIPIQTVYGNFVSFIKEYQEYLTDDHNDMIRSKIEQSKLFELDKVDVLDKKLRYIEVEGISLPQKIEV